MLLFSTILDINDSLTKDGFVDLVLEWNNTGSRASNVVPGIEWNNSFGVKFGSDDLWLKIDDHSSRGIVAARHEKVEEDGTVWDTDIVMNFEDMKMSVRLDRSYQEDALRIDADFSTPHFISLLIRKSYLQDDAGLPVLREPVVVDAAGADCFCSAVNNLVAYSLPILYVSKVKKGGYPFDIGLLASKLKGIAHVFAEGGCSEKDFVKLSDEQPCVKGGDVAIHFPSQSIESMVVSFAKGVDERVMLAKVIRPVVQYNNSRALDSLYTWDGVRNDLLLGRLEAQREKTRKSEKAAEDVNELLSIVDDEFKDMREEMRRLANRVTALEAENFALRSRENAASSSPLLYMGNEREFFDGEVKDLVLSTLKRALKDIREGTRRYDVVSDVVRSNGYEGICKARAEEMKKLLKSSNPTSERFEHGLEKLGFVTANNKKHLKARYYGDKRYLVTFAKTPGDMRSAANSAADFAKKAF